MVKRSLVLAAFLAPVVGPAHQGALAAEFWVSNAEEFRQALLAAETNGQHDTVRVRQGTYVGSFRYRSSERRDIRVLGGYQAAPSTVQELDPTNTIIDGAAFVPLELVNDDGGDVEVQGFTLTNGVRGGLHAASTSGSRRTGDVVVMHNVISGNSNVRSLASIGGGVTAASSSAKRAGNVTVAHNTVTGNRATESGGGIHATSFSLDDQAGDVVVTHNTVSDNEVVAGFGGGGVWASSNSVRGDLGTVTLSHNVITGNELFPSEDRATRGGGAAIEVAAGGDSRDGEIVATDNTFANNSMTTDSSSSGGGGGLYALIDHGPLTIRGNSFTGNAVHESSNGWGPGGGVWAHSFNGDFALDRNTFVGNSAVIGGGAHVSTSTTTLMATENEFLGNSVSQTNLGSFWSGAGGLYASSGDGAVVVARNLIHGNTSARSCAGVNVDGPPTTRIMHNRMTGNTAAAEGGGLCVRVRSTDRTLDILVENNWIAGNSAGIGAGARIGAIGGGRDPFVMTLAHNTVAGNSQPGTDRGGGILLLLSRDSVVDLFNNILWENSPGTFEDGQLYIRDFDVPASGLPATVNVHDNIFDVLTADAGVDLTEQDNLDVDPLLVDTTDADPANWDLHLASGSPAIDAGTGVNAPDTDFEGNVRPQQTGHDIGADEFVPDGDGDGIADEVDTSPGAFSSGFEDATGTSGTITDRGDQTLTITDALDPEGVRVVTDPAGGPDPADVSFCGGSYNAVLSPGEFVVRGCSFEIDVLDGNADLTLLLQGGTPVTTSLMKGNGLQFDGAVGVFTAPPTNSQEVVVVVEGEEFGAMPGQTASVLEGDLDADGDVDQADVDLLTSRLNTSATGPRDPADLDGDGEITGLDARMLVLLCTRDRCETEDVGTAGGTPACGLGWEPVLALVPLRWRHARRRRQR